MDEESKLADSLQRLLNFSKRYVRNNEFVTFDSRHHVFIKMYDHYIFTNNGEFRSFGIGHRYLNLKSKTI